MPRQAPGLGPDDERPASSAGGPVSSAGDAVPSAGDAVPSAGGPASSAGGAVWPKGLDYQALLEGLAAGGYLDGKLEEQEEARAEELAAAKDGRMLPADPAWTAALATEHMEPGPAQAGWLEVAATAAERLSTPWSG